MRIFVPLGHHQLIYIIGLSTGLGLWIFVSVLKMGILGGLEVCESRSLFMSSMCLPRSEWYYWPSVAWFSPGGVLPYITYTGMCRPTGSWFWSSWFRTGYPFQRRFLERGIFRTHESSSFVSSHLKLFKDRLLLKIRFNALTSELLYSCCTLERSIKNWPISRTVSVLGEFFFRTGCQFGVQGDKYPPKKYPSAPPPGVQYRSFINSPQGFQSQFTIYEEKRKIRV